MKDLILFSTPEAAVVPHFVVQCILARTMKEQGYKVALVRCPGLYSRCPAMDMYAIPYDASPEDRQQACNKCLESANSMLSEYGLDYIDLGTAVTHEMVELANRIVDNWQGDLAKVTHESVRFGEFSLHDVVLALKKYNFEELDTETFLAWTSYIRSSILSYLITDRICTELPVGAVVHFNDYSLQLGARMAGIKNGAGTYSVSLAAHKSADFRNFIINKDIWRQAFYETIKYWSDWRNLSIDENRVREVVEDSIGRMTSRSIHVYSPAKTFNDADLLDRLGLCHGKKTIVAYTSSYDELIAGQKLVMSLGYPKPDITLTFPDQISWLKALVAHLSSHADLQLIVRIHPREGVNKRDSNISQHLLVLQKEFASLPENCRFIWPEDPISSYDLAELANLVVIGWSTIGLEMARFGIPVLAINRGTTYPGDDFIEFAETEREYFEKFHRLLSRNLNPEALAHAYRYHSCFNLGYATDLSDLIPSSDATLGFKGVPPFVLPREAVSIAQTLTGCDTTFNINLQRLRAAQEPGSVAREREAIRRASRALIHYFMTGEEINADYRLLVVESDAESEIEADSDSAIMIINGNSVSYKTPGGKTYGKFSPLCARLARFSGKVPTQRHPVAARRIQPLPIVTDGDAALETARNLAAQASYPAAIDWYEALIKTFPASSIQLMAEVYDRIYEPLGNTDRYSLYVSRFFDFQLQPGDRVLDIGSGHLPFPFATHLADLTLEDGSLGRAGSSFKHLDGKEIYECNVEKMPFADKEFDFVYCSHVLEHTNDPARACREIMRVGKRGYIETPMPATDLMMNTAAISNHAWGVELEGKTLVFKEYSEKDIEGLDSSILLDMNCSPQTIREKAFSALLNLKADRVNTMLYWEDSFGFEVKWQDNRKDRLADETHEPSHQTNCPVQKSTVPEKPLQAVFLNTYYPAFINGIYLNNPMLHQQSYETQKSLLQSECFGDSDFYSIGMAKAGINTEDLIINCGPLQSAWAREHGYHESGSSLVVEQLHSIRPDIIYVQDMNNTDEHFIDTVKCFTSLLIGQIATPIFKQIPFEKYDIIISSFPHFVERFRKSGLTAYYQPLAFDPRVLDQVGNLPFRDRPIGCSFVGGISNLHIESYNLLERLALNTPIEFWGYGAETLPAESMVRKRHHGEAWGKTMFLSCRSPGLPSTGTAKLLKIMPIICDCLKPLAAGHCSSPTTRTICTNFSK